MGHKRVRSLGCLLRHRSNLEARCPCGRISVLDGRALYRRFNARNWASGIELVARHLRCTGCGQRGPDIFPTLAEPTPGVHLAPDRAALARTPLAGRHPIPPPRAR